MGIDYKSLLEHTYGKFQVESYSIPTNEHVNQILDAIEIYCRSLGYDFEYASKGAQVRNNWRGVNAHFKVSADTIFNIEIIVTDEWVWEITGKVIAVNSFSNDIHFEETIELQTQSLEEIGLLIKQDILDHLPEANWNTKAFESVFSRSLLKSTKYMRDSEFISKLTK